MADRLRLTTSHKTSILSTDLDLLFSVSINSFVVF